ncbi:response regulator [Daejeonella sp.]|uniref:response regulator transcription factor n=1 Tax=Daejeonella sp. TaxID=2805397 RepID=UPI0030BFE97A
MGRILVVDDNEEILEVIELILQSEGYEVQCCQTGNDLLSTVHTFNPDVVLLDIILGGYDGRVLCNELKANSKTAHIPVILMSAAHNLKIAICPADGYIPKPFEIEYLVETVAALVKKPASL